MLSPNSNQSSNQQNSGRGQYSIRASKRKKDLEALKMSQSMATLPDPVTYDGDNFING